MNSRMIYLAALCLSCLCTAMDAQERNSISSDQVETWIQQLDSNSSSKRDAATKALLEAGVPACESVFETFLNEKSSVEASYRCLAILEAWVEVGDIATWNRVQSELDELDLEQFPSRRQSLEKLKADIIRMSKASEKDIIERLNELGANIGYGDPMPTSKLRDGYSLYLDDWRGSIDELKRVRRVRSPIFVHGKGRINYAILDALAGSNLQFLWIRSEITDEMATLLGTLHPLKELQIGQAKFGASTIEALGNLSNLKRLQLGYEMNEDWCSALSDLPQLEQLDFGYAGFVTGKGLGEIGPIPTLKEINLDHTSVQGSELHHLRDNPQLEIVTTPTKFMTDEGLEIVSKMPNLRVLSVGGMVSARGMSHLKKCEHLEELRFRSTPLPSTQLFASIAEIPNLKKVSIARSFLTPEMIVALNRSASLEEISLRSSLIESNVVDELSLRTQNREWNIRESTGPNSSIQNRAQKLIEVGIGVVPGPSESDALSAVYIVSEQFKGTARDLALLRDIECRTLVLDIPIDDEIVDQILFGPDVRELVVSDVIRHDLFVRLSQRFPKVVLRQSSWN